MAARLTFPPKRPLVMCFLCRRNGPACDDLQGLCFECRTSMRKAAHTDTLEGKLKWAADRGRLFEGRRLTLINDKGTRAWSKRQRSSGLGKA